MSCNSRVLSIIALSLVASLVPSFSRADGMYVSPEDQDLVEPTQIGLIVHDGVREDLYLQVDFQESAGRAVSRMGWILALPSVPDTTEADEGLFVELMKLTRPYENDDAFGYGCSGSEKAGADLAANGSLEIERRQVVGAFDVTTVTSESVSPLAAWISERGFVLREGSEEILQFYVDKAWHFVAVEVDLAEAAADGFLPPLRFSFDSAEPVFPLRISAINGLGHDSDEDYYYGEGTEVLVYVVSSRALFIAGESVIPEFTHEIDGDDLGDFPAVRAALPSSGVITKLRLFRSSAEMTDDLYFTPATDGTTDLLASRGSFGLSWIAIGVLVAGGAGLRLRRKRRDA